MVKPVEFDLLGLTEQQERTWAAYLKEFHESIYPLFERHNIPMGDALIIFKINEMRNEIIKLQDIILEVDTEDDGESDGWTKTT